MNDRTPNRSSEVGDRFRLALDAVCGYSYAIQTEGWEAPKLSDLINRAQDFEVATTACPDRVSPGLPVLAATALQSQIISENTPAVIRTIFTSLYGEAIEALVPTESSTD